MNSIDKIIYSKEYVVYSVITDQLYVIDGRTLAYNVYMVHFSGDLPEDCEYCEYCFIGELGENQPFKAFLLDLKNFICLDWEEL